MDQLPSAWFNFSPLSRRPSEKSRSRSIKKITIDYYYHNIYYCHYLEHIIFLFLSTFSPPLERPSKNLDRKNGKITIIAEHHRPSIIPFFVQFFFFFFLLFLSLLPFRHVFFFFFPLLILGPLPLPPPLSLLLRRVFTSPSLVLELVHLRVYSR